MSTLQTLVALGDEHVGPYLSVWECTPSSTATRTVPKNYSTLEDAMTWAYQHLKTSSQTRDWPWIRRTDGGVLSPTYLRAYGKAR